MILCNDTVTVYNAKLNPVTGSDDYVATVISGVSWFGEVLSNVDSSGLKAANRFTVRIPDTANFNGKTYVAPLDFAGSANTDGLFTLQSGDIVVHGAVAEPNARPAVLHKKYEAFTVLGVTDNRRTRNARHWKVVGM